MAKYCNPDVIDAALNTIKNNAVRMVLLASQPASYAAAVSDKLAEAVMASGDFTLAAGDIDGRKVTVAAKNNQSILVSGSANHVALLDTTNSRLLYVTTCPATSLVQGGTVNIAAWAVEIGAPV